MTTIVTRAGKGSPLTHTEVDTNFTNLNTNKLETAAIPLGTAAAPSISFLSDADSGLFSPGANQVAVATNGTSRLSIDASGNVAVDTNTLYVDAVNNRVAIGTTGPNYELQINASDALSAIQLTNTSTGTTASDGFLVYNNGVNATISNEESGYIRFQTTGLERAQLDSSGRLLVGTSSARGGFDNNSSVSSNLQVEGAGTAAGGTRTALSIVNNGNADADSAGLYLARSGGTAVSSFTAVTVDDVLGRITFSGADGTEFVAGASIEAVVDGTPGANDMPGRLVFSTCPDSGSSPVERMRIKSSGGVEIGTNVTPSGIALNVYGTSTSNNDGSCTFGNGNTADAATIASFYTGATGTTTSNVFIKFGINFSASGSGQINANGASAAAFGSYSDARLKENIQNLPSQWEKIKSLRPVEFDYLESFGGGHQIGFIAQEMQAVYPDAVGIGDDEMLTVTAWSKTEARLIKTLQEAIGRIEDLESEVAALKAA